MSQDKASMTSPTDTPKRLSDVVVRRFADELRKYWSFDDGQMHTHSDALDYLGMKAEHLLRALPLPVSADGGGAVKWPFGLQKGEWTWRSFTAGENAGKTIVQIKVQRPERDGFQSWLTLDWYDYDGREVYGRGDAEDTAKLICDAMNAFLKSKQPDAGAEK